MSDEVKPWTFDDFSSHKHNPTCIIFDGENTKIATVHGKDSAKLAQLIVSSVNHTLNPSANGT